MDHVVTRSGSSLEGELKGFIRWPRFPPSLGGLTQGSQEYEREAGRLHAPLRLKEEFVKDVRRHGSQFVERQYIPITRTIAPTRAQETQYKKAIIEYLRRQLSSPSLRRMYNDSATYRDDVTAVSSQLERIVQFVDDPL